MTDVRSSRRQMVSGSVYVDPIDRRSLSVQIVIPRSRMLQSTLDLVKH